MSDTYEYPAEVVQKWNKENKAKTDLITTLLAVIEQCEVVLSYSETVRMDRPYVHPDWLDEFQLQTTDWCQGLLDNANQAKGEICIPCQFAALNNATDEWLGGQP